MAKKPKFEKLSVNMQRRGELRYDTAYNARDAAKIATKAAKAGWSVEVQPWQSLGTKRNILMSCTSWRGTTERRPAESKPIAKCTMSPAFKKRLKLR